TDNDVTRMTAEIYLKEMLDGGVDTIVLGCTHYPLLKHCISGVVGEKVTLVDPAKATAVKMKKFLEQNDMLNGGTEEKHNFYVSDHTESFDILCERLLKQHYTAEKTDIEKY
ncbi:MAG: aspartate/glutamate racemase family protein, partial [Firmicutes bacterium]|nr:aspartate/glutamate racemase family protein [Bacillota bacterium]